MSNLYDAPVPFVGVGTGRCGSHTLVEIISACKNTNVYHETINVPWYEPGASPELGVLMKRLINARKLGLLAGEVSPSIINSVGVLRGDIPGLKVVCLHRGREQVVRSFCEYGVNMPPLRPLERHRWAEGCLGAHYGDAKIPLSFPVIDGASRQQAISFYWEMYESMMREVAEPVMHIHIEALNDAKAVESLFEFLDIPVCDRVFIEVRKFWSISDSEEAKMANPRRKPDA